MRNKAASLLVGLAFVSLAACGDDTKTGQTSQPATTVVSNPTTVATSGTTVTTVAPVTTVASTGCIAAAAFAKRVNVASASAVKETVTTKPAGLYRKGFVWFVSTRDGATWVTNADPTVDESGLTYPLNAKARAASELGVDVAAGAPVFEGLTDSSPGAVRSRTCAGA